MVNEFKSEKVVKMNFVRLRNSWKSFRFGQKARLDGRPRVYTYDSAYSEHDNSVFEKSFFEGWDNPNKK